MTHIYLLTCFIALTLYLWHRCAVAQHRKTVEDVERMKKAVHDLEMQQWKRRNEDDIDDWIGGE